MTAKQRDPQTLPFDFLLESSLRLYHRAYLQAAAEKLGFQQVERAIVHTYRATGSIPRTAELLDSSYTTIHDALVKLGEPLKQRGGANNPYGRRKTVTS